MNRKNTVKKVLQDGLILFIGATLTAFGTKYIYDPSGMVTGGVSGLSIVLRYVSSNYLGFEIPLWMGSILLNLPIFLLALYTDGKKNIARTAVVWVIMTLELYLFPDYRFIEDNLLLIAIYGGLSFGVGTGLLLRAGATSGGTDMLGKSLHHYFPQVTMGRMIQILDGCVVLIGAAVFHVERTLFAILSVYVMGRVTDYVLDTGKSAKMAMIISEQNDSIAKEILRELDRGVTALNGTGMYTGEPKKVLVCICSRRDLVVIKNIVTEYDPKAFFTVGDVSEVMGEGFMEDWQEKGI